MSRLPTQEQFVHNVWENSRIKLEHFTRNFAFFEGVLFVVVGCYFPQLFRFAENYVSLKYFLVVYGMAVSSPAIALFAGAALLAVANAWRLSYRCPRCHRRFLWKSYMTAGNHCPHCRRALYVSEKIGQLSLPEFTFYNLTYLCFLPASMLFCLVCASFIQEVPKALLYTQLAWIGVGILWIAVFPLFAWTLGKYLRRREAKRCRENACPVCGAYYDPLILRLSGNCSVCGSLLDSDWPPAEPKPLADLPTAREVCAVRQNKMDIYVLLFMLGWFFFCGIQLFMPQEHLLRTIPSFIPWGLLMMLLYVLIHVFRSWKILKPFRKCPYCHFGLMQKKAPEWNPNSRNVELYKYYFLRCPNCRRKLVRNENDGKEATHERFKCSWNYR